MKTVLNILIEKEWTLDEAKAIYETFKNLYISCQTQEQKDEFLDVINYFYQLINNKVTGVDQFGNVTTSYNVPLLK